MPRISARVAGVLVTAVIFGLGVVGGATGGAGVRQVEVLDACDPATFNNGPPGPGSCNRPGGGVTFSDFVQQLLSQGEAPAWRFAPGQLRLSAGGTLLATNRGGEDHTFTEVAAFGGGCVAPLNSILG